MNIYEFMQNNPWLTFFLFLITGNTLVYIVSEISKTFRKK